MSPPPVSPRKRLYLLHRWIGLVVGSLGALVLFSGTLAIFAAELREWSVREPLRPPAIDAPGFDLDRIHRSVVEDLDPPLHHHVDFVQDAGGLLQVTALNPETGTGVAVDFDPATLETIERHEGPASEFHPADPRDALVDFVIDLHVFLSIPGALGLLTTGMVGLGLLISLVSGFVAHSPTWAKMKRAPRTRRSRLWFGDWHTLVGTWTLPFALVLATTGAFFSMSSIVLRPAISMSAFHGDPNALVQALIATPVPPPGPGQASLDPMLRDALSRNERAQLRRVQLRDWGTPEARATLTLETEHWTGDTRHVLTYDGHEGQILRDHPYLGSTPSFGGRVLHLVDELHFGTLLGLPTKLLWFLSGLALCGVASAGLLVFVSRQRDPSALVTRVMRGLAVATSVGLPVAVVLGTAGWALACTTGAWPPATAVRVGFFAGLAFMGVVGIRWALRPALLGATIASGIALCTMPLWALLANGGPSAVMRAETGTMLVDVAWWIAGLGMVACAGRAMARRRARAATHRGPRPASST
ncbi:MAG: PepSY-associated TM helix domain-containing protein [Myxococcota bacterium]